MDHTKQVVPYGGSRPEAKPTDNGMPSLGQLGSDVRAVPTNVLQPQQSAINQFPTELLQMIDSYAMGDQTLVALEDLNEAGHNILTSFSFSRFLAGVFLTDFARNRCIEMTSLQLAYMAPSTTHAGHHTFGKDKIVLPIHDKRVRSLLITVTLKWDARNDYQAFSALWRMPKVLDRLSKAFINLRNLTIKLEWAPELETVSLATLDGLLARHGLTEASDFNKAYIRLFDAISKVQDPGKFITFAHTDTQVDLSGLDRRTVMLRVIEMWEQKVMTTNFILKMMHSGCFFAQARDNDDGFFSLVNGILVRA